MSHGFNEHCEITVIGNATLTMNPSFNIEVPFDELMIAGIVITPDNRESLFPMEIAVGEVIEWRTDSQTNYQGFQMCFQEQGSRIEGQGTFPAPDVRISK